MRFPKCMTIAGSNGTKWEILNGARSGLNVPTQSGVLREPAAELADQVPCAARGHSSSPLNLGSAPWSELIRLPAHCLRTASFASNTMQPWAMTQTQCDIVHRDRKCLFDQRDGDATADDFGDAMSKATSFGSISATRPWSEKCRGIE